MKYCLIRARRDAGTGTGDLPSSPQVLMSRGEEGRDRHLGASPRVPSPTRGLLRRGDIWRVAEGGGGSARPPLSTKRWLLKPHSHFSAGGAARLLPGARCLGAESGTGVFQEFPLSRNEIVPISPVFCQAQTRVAACSCIFIPILGI